MLKDICSNVCLNKNILMLATVGVYILALVSVFWGVQFWTAGILTLILIVFLVKNLFPAKYVLVWAIIFYLGVLNTSFRLRETDDLLNIAPVNSTVYGKILSIPQNKIPGTVFSLHTTPANPIFFRFLSIALQAFTNMLLVK